MWPTTGRAVGSTIAQAGPAGRACRSVEVLVVDDAVLVRDYIEEFLTDAGFGTTTACNGFEGLRELHAKHPAVVLTDLSMPGMGGLEFIGRVRELSDVPVIVVSVEDDERTKVRALERGADDYVVKPVRPAELVARAAPATTGLPSSLVRSRRTAATTCRAASVTAHGGRSGRAELSSEARRPTDGRARRGSASPSRSGVGLTMLLESTIVPLV